MAHISIDLQDGKPPVSFTLNAADTDRFQAFMAKFSTLQDAVNNAHERLDNTVAANVIPMGDSLRAKALCEITETLRDYLAPHIDY